MNSKRERKITKKVETAKQSYFSNPLNDPREWLSGNIPCPWSPERMQEFQKRIDSAFGADYALILAWSYDKQYWDEFYTDWSIGGTPKGKLEKKPILLFGQYTLNETDYVYISAPRFLLLERLHGSQLEASWDESSWTEDNEMLGGKKRIRAKKPPESFYQVLKTIAVHEEGERWGKCCERLWKADKRICYGKYREPDARDIEYVGKIAENMKRAGVVQRNDAPRSAKVLEAAASSTRHFMEQSARMRRKAVQELILSDPQQYMGDILRKHNIDWSAGQIEKTLKEGFKRSEDSI